MEYAWWCDARQQREDRMNQTIDMSWIPDKRSTDALKAKGYDNKQLNHIRRCFIRRNLNKEIPSASAAYSNMVKSSGSGNDIKRVKPEYEVHQELQREQALRDKTKQPKPVKGEPFTQEQAREHYMKRGS